jgi:site-specific recombinase XerC
MARPASAPSMRLYGPDTKHGAKAKRGYTTYTYYIIHRVDGRLVERSTGSGLGGEAQAQRALGEYIISLRKDTAGEDLTVTEVLRHYLAEKPKDPDIQKSDLQHAKWLERNSQEAKLLAAFFSKKTMATITAGDCRDYYESRTGKVAHNTIRRELSLIKAAVRWSASRGRIKVMPILYVPKPDAAAKKRRKAMPVLTRNQIAAMVRGARTSYHMRNHFPIFILLSYFFCHRRAAVLTLRWERHNDGGWIDLENGIIDFNRGDGLVTSKGRSSDRIPGILATILRGLRKRSKNGWVIEDAGEPIKQPRGAWSACCEAAGVVDGREGGGFTPHDLIHAGITHRLQAGESLFSVSRLTGRSIQMLDEVYGHHVLDTIPKRPRGR